jgi:large subunit ribosomal protein L2
MIFKKSKPITPSRRFMVNLDYKKLLTTNKPFKPLLFSTLKGAAGRNNDGRITCRHKGGGHTRKYRLIDFKRDKDNIPCVVETIEYDPNRSSFISLVKYEDGERRYILTPHSIEIGQVLVSGDQTAYHIGNCMKLKYIPNSTQVHLIEMNVGQGGLLCRTAGGFARIFDQTGNYTLVKMPSGEIRKILSECRATIGRLSNDKHNLCVLGKAGASRWRGIRPTVRGVAMNPIDHPHGGGEGKGKNHHPVSPWGQLSKGKKTRHNKRTDTMIIMKRKGSR